MKRLLAVVRCILLPASIGLVRRTDGAEGSSLSRTSALARAGSVMNLPGLIAHGGEYGNPYRGENRGLEIDRSAVPPKGTLVKLILRKSGQ
jgi:hypothetical protein